MDLKKISMWLVCIGGLNIGLSALGINVLHMLLGGLGIIETLVYLVIGLAALMGVLEMLGMSKKGK